MSKKILLIIGILALSSFTLLVLLSNTLNEKNGFDRIYSFNDIVLQKEFNLNNLPIKVKDICNSNNKPLYVSTFDPRFYFKFDQNLKLIDTLKVGLETKLAQYINSGFDASIMDSLLIIYAKNSGLIIRYKVGSKHYNVIQSPSQLITKSLTMDTSYSTLRIFNKDNTQSFIKISNIDGKEQNRSNIINSDPKGGFSTDGMLVYNTRDSIIFYIQYYTNKFYCLDKNFNLLYENHTIDTIFHNPIENSKFHTRKSGQFMPEVPLKNINKDASSYNNRLVINSSLIADNEPRNLLQKNYIFDIYNTSTGKYISSIKIPKFGTNNMLDFKVNDNKFILLCDNKLLIINVTIP